jgi:DnaJ-class molecular chaperone
MPGGSYQFSGDQAHKIFEELFGGGFGASSGRSRPFGGGGFSGFGGGGGFPDGGMGGGMDTDDSHPFFSFGGGMPSSSGRAAPPRTVEVALKLTLKELYSGTTKRLKITRRVPDPSDPSKLTTKEEILEIQVKPGWKEGTRITFQGKGDQLPGRPAQDIVFVVQQIPDPIFDRDGDDLIIHVSIYLSKALTEGKIDVPHLDGRTLRVPLKEVVTPGYTRRVKGEGMPNSRNPSQKGDLRIVFEVEFPKEQLKGVEAAQLIALLGEGQVKIMQRRV